MLPGAAIHGGEVTPGRFQRGAIKATRQHHAAIAPPGACGIRQAHQATLWHPSHRICRRRDAAHSDLRRSGRSRPERPRRTWRAGDHHVLGVGWAVTTCGQAPSLPEARAHTEDMGRIIGTILGAILAIWLAFMAAGGIVATLKTFLITGLIAMAVFIVVWLVAKRPRRG